MKMRKIGLALAFGLMATAVSQAPFSLTAMAAAKLGDLSKFRKIAVDTEALVGRGKLPEAKARIKDLELAWDEAEPSLKPRGAAEWHTIDKAIDRSLEDLRAATPDAKSCRKSLLELLTVLDRTSGEK